MTTVAPALPYDYDVVSRRVNQRASSLSHVVRLLPRGVGQLRLDRPFAWTGGDNIPSWCARGRLYAEGAAMTRYTRVQIELAAWSPEASELRIRPVTRRVPTWGRRRQRRYFRLAHSSVDDLVRVLDGAVRRHEALTTLERSVPTYVSPRCSASGPSAVGSSRSAGPGDPKPNDGE
jgi:hypothetical protein